MAHRTKSLKKGEPVHRSSMVIPTKVKKDMMRFEKFHEYINWSAVATAAFVDLMEKVAAGKKVPKVFTMSYRLAQGHHVPGKKGAKS